MAIIKVSISEDVEQTEEVVAWISEVEKIVNNDLSEKIFNYLVYGSTKIESD